LASCSTALGFGGSADSDLTAPETASIRVLYRGCFLAIIDICNVAIVEKIQHGVIETVEQAVLIEHPEKSAGSNDNAHARCDVFV